MKNYNFILIFTLVVLTALIVTDTSAASPKISFEKTVHDFGKIAAGTKNICEFKFTNSGTDVLKIGKIKATCDCTVFDLKKQ